MGAFSRWLRDDCGHGRTDISAESSEQHSNFFAAAMALLLLHRRRQLGADGLAVDGEQYDGCGGHNSISQEQAKHIPNADVIDTPPTHPKPEAKHILADLCAYIGQHRAAGG
mmetsp:Transcript_60688/g.143434  ORF Transcript_60688/g.143434 Transcript_60688/m.143434 type:complete len:112 (+) Transcript_60688:2192-2527(+)